MNTWIKRSLMGLTAAVVALGALAACGSRGDHARGWSDERVTEMRGKALVRISKQLDLNPDQQQKLGVLADEVLATRSALKGTPVQPRDALKALVAGDKFDRTKAQLLLDQTTQTVQGQAPKLLDAMAAFYDSLSPAQQAQVRARLDQRRGGHRG